MSESSGTLTEVAPNLFVGSAVDTHLRYTFEAGWAVVHATQTCHRKLLGYTTRGAPKDDPEYLYADRGSELFMNLVDADSVAYIHPLLIGYAIGWIQQQLEQGKWVLVHCDSGVSRAPSIALLYLYSYGKLTGPDPVAQFKALYPPYDPGPGMREFVREAIDGDAGQAEAQATEG